MTEHTTESIITVLMGYYMYIYMYTRFNKDDLLYIQKVL